MDGNGTAASIPRASAVLDDGTFRSAGELRDLYGGKGVTADNVPIELGWRDRTSAS
jgi:hypothetical protein